MIEVSYEIISEILIPLLVVVVCGFAGYFFAKKPGFFAGINVGLLIAVLELGFPEYFLVVLAIVDIVLIFGAME